MVGGGQLARMTHQAAIALGQSLSVLATAQDDAAALVTPDVQIGEPTDLAALRSFAAGCDVLTFDHEHVPAAHLRTLQAEGVRVYPGPQALIFAQDKAAMRARLSELGAPVPAYSVLAGPADSTQIALAIEGFGAGNDWPVVVKTARGGYDGRGVWVLKSSDEGAGFATEVAGRGDATDLVIESFVPMRRELAVVLARSSFGQAAVWPVVQTVQQGGICVEVIAPAPGLDEEIAFAASRLALKIAAELDVVGVLAVELFEVDRSERFPDGLVVNELAMRPHNSGHWTMDGSVTGQFEQHLRAVLDYPLGRTEMTAPFTVMGNVLGGPANSAGAAMGIDERVHHLAARFPEVKIHLYGKGFRPGRKLGHVNVSGDDLPHLRRAARLASDWLGSGIWTDGYSVHGPAGDDRTAGVRGDAREQR